MTVTTYRNKKNGNKYIQVKRYACGHYYFRQYMYWNTKRGPVVCFMGTVKNGGQYHRNGLRSMLPVISEDYEEVCAQDHPYIFGVECKPI